MADEGRVVPDSTVPGTPAWVETVVANTRRYADFTEKDVRPLVQRYRDLCEHKAWETWLTGEPKTLDRFCTEALGYEAEFLETMSVGVAVLDQKGFSGPVSVDAARAAVQAQVRVQAAWKEFLDATDAVPLPENGQVGRGRSDSFDNIKANQGGTSESYLRRRLKRDYPDLYEQVRSGAMKASVAAKQAGIQHPYISVRLDDPHSVARSLEKHMSAEDFGRLIDLLTRRVN